MFQHINHIFKTNKSEVLRWYHFSVRLNFQNPNLVVWCNFKGDSKHTGGSALWKSSFVILRKNSQTPLLLHRSLTPIASPELLKYPTLKMPPLIQPGATLLTLLPFPALQLSIMKKNRSSWMKSFSLSLSSLLLKLSSIYSSDSKIYIMEGSETGLTGTEFFLEDKDRNVERMNREKELTHYEVVRQPSHRNNKSCFCKMGCQRWRIAQHSHSH